MKILTSTIAKSRNKVMRTAWHLFRNTELNFSEALKKAWEIIKEAFHKIELQNGMFSLSEGYKMYDRPQSEINKEMTKNIVWLVDWFLNDRRLRMQEEAREKRKVEISMKYSPIEADHIIYNTSLD